ncbi:GNAT family protein [Xylocopilactobacillus apicola]|nr:GNAT family protein [Xylocopilactobacillus apicola]
MRNSLRLNYIKIIILKRVDYFFNVEINEKRAEIGLGLKPSLTGQGRGTKFCQAIIDHILQRNPGLGLLQLDVVAFNEWAIHTYELLDFKKVRRHL